MLLGERDTGKEICDVQGASAANAASHQARLLLFKAIGGTCCHRVAHGALLENDTYRALLEGFNDVNVMIIEVVRSHSLG
jgi:CO dehydrogenase/acetyl-CoA synthase alpha subunit